MEEKASLSEQQIADAGLQRTEKTPRASARHIAQLRDMAVEAPERRAEIIAALEEQIARGRGTASAKAACRAITTITAVSMLEILQGV